MPISPPPTRLPMPWLLSALALAACASLLPQDLRAAEIAWLESPGKAAQRSRQLDLPVVMYITSENCGYCRKMEREVWSNPAIVNTISNRFVPLKVEASEHRELVAALKVKAFPTTILFSPEAKAIKGATGYLSSQQLGAMFQEAFASTDVQATPVAAQRRVVRRAAPPIRWIESAEIAFRDAQQSERPLVVYVGSEDCVHCRRMERDVWSDASVSAVVEGSFVPLALNAQRDAALIKALQVKAYPTTIVLSPQMEVLSGLAGYAPAVRVTRMLQTAQAGPTASRAPTPTR